VCSLGLKGPKHSDLIIASPRQNFNHIPVSTDFNVTRGEWAKTGAPDPQARKRKARCRVGDSALS
jgi:hypothetical protein